MAVTIAEISVECGVSEQAIRAWCRRNHVAKDAKGSFAITETQKTAIYQHYLGIDRKEVSQPAKASCETCETSETALITMLERELDRKSEQLAVKDKQIAELNERLSECSAALLAAQQTTQAAQVLHAGTIQKEIASGESGVDKQKSASEKKNRSFWLIGVVLLCAVVFMIAMISTKRSLSDWGKISSIEYCENILDEKISEIRIRKGIDSAKWAVFSDEDLVNKWMEFLSTIEVRRVDNAGRGQQEQNGGNFVVEIDTETEEYCLVFKSTDAIMQLEVNDADYDVKMPEDFPFEETYNKAIERYGVKGPWD